MTVPDMLAWHYGSEHDDRMIHTGCGGEVFALGGGLICDRCGKRKLDEGRKR